MNCALTLNGYASSYARCSAGIDVSEYQTTFCARTGWSSTGCQGFPCPVSRPSTSLRHQVPLHTSPLQPTPCATTYHVFHLSRPLIFRCPVTSFSLSLSSVAVAVSPPFRPCPMYKDVRSSQDRRGICPDTIKFSHDVSHTRTPNTVTAVSLIVSRSLRK